jgi:tetratricopeptide (TPR) repeat protein
MQSDANRVEPRQIYAARPFARAGACSSMLAAVVGLTSTSLAAGMSDELAGSEPRSSASAGAESSPTHTRIKALISELGSPQFATRRAAASELRRIGPDAFDALFAATEHTDPEVAASANYLLRQISVRWTTNDDSAATRRILRNYGDATNDARLTDVLQLSMLSNREGLAALCRIARYDRSPLISRTAAVAVIWPDTKSGRRTPIDPQVIEREIGPSTRIAAVWLRQLTAQLRSPAASIAGWQRLIDEESARLTLRSDETNAEVATGLMWNLADIHRQLGHQPALSQTIDQILRVDSDDPERMAVAMLMWLVEEKSMLAVEELLNKHSERFSRGKRPLYASAIARKQQGKNELADELAEKASREESTEPLGSFEIAKDLEYRDHFDWAVREHRRVIDSEPTESPESIVSRVTLASLLHDHEQFQAAADVVSPLVKSNTDPKTARLYDESRQFMAGRYGIGIPARTALAAQFHFYLANAHRVNSDWQRERDELELAIRFDPEDSDVLIAMYRAYGADEAWMAKVRQKIATLSQEYQRQIDAAPNVAQNYNQWAWLISNTEGDYEQAIRYSQKSLELNTAGETASASYLDTLGRCYYAAGDYESAVKYQRQAVEKISYMKTMQRQLELFEKALAGKTRGTSDR